MSTRMLKDEEGVLDVAPKAEKPAVVFTAEERRVLREVLKRLNDAPPFGAVEVPGEQPLDPSYYFVPICTRIEPIERGDPRVDWEEHDRRVAWMLQQPPDGEFEMELE